MLKQWEERIIMFQCIYSCLMRHDFIFNNIPDEIKNEQDIYNVAKHAHNVLWAKELKWGVEIIRIQGLVLIHF